MGHKHLEYSRSHVYGWEGGKIPTLGEPII